jgi:hypothetical protein
MGKAFGNALSYGLLALMAYSASILIAGTAHAPIAIPGFAIHWQGVGGGVGSMLNQVTSAIIPENRP